MWVAIERPSQAGEAGAGVAGLGGEAKEKAPGEKGFTLKDDGLGKKETKNKQKVMLIGHE